VNPVNEHGDMIAISAYRKMEADLYDEIYDLEHENAGLRIELEQQAVVNGKGSEREAALLAKVETLEGKNALQGLHLATMADVVLGENAEDRSDETLVREVCRMAREYAKLMPIVEAATAYVDYDIEGESTLWPEANEKFEALKSAVESRKEQP
jgi:hypothetical protein